MAVSVTDFEKDSLSSVYHYFDPDEGRRSLGTFSILAEIELCKRQNRSHYYLGYWIQGCASMEYKGQFGPHETLYEGEWRRQGEGPSPQRKNDHGSKER